MAGLLLAGLCGIGFAAVNDDLVESAEGAVIAEQLRAAPSQTFEFDQASLRDVLRMLADEAGISFVSLPESGVDQAAAVTFSIKASPFRALEVIAKANGIGIFYEDGIWYLRPYNDQKLIGRTYKIQYNTQEIVENEGSSLNSPTTATGGIGGTQSGGGTTQDIGLSLQGASNVFKVNPNPMIKEIKALLGIPTDGLSAALAPEATVNSTTPLELTPNALDPASGGAARRSGDVASGPNGAQVIWNADSSTLYVVATRQQHEWVEGYLASVDRPQNLIGIEVKFFESVKDPRKQLGLDWAGTLGNGFTLQATDLRAAAFGDITLDQRNTQDTQQGNLPPGQSPFNFETSNRTTTITAATPYSAVLSASDVALTVRAFLADRDTTTVSYPRVLTINNREVVIRSVINQPVLASSSSVTPGVGGTTTASVAYLPIGTIINILPKTLADNSVVLNVSVTVSSIVGTETIGGSPYPIASSRVYNAELQVDSGYTLAIGGLEEAIDQRFRNGIPFLKDIPVLGEAFKSNDVRRQKKNLMIFITPTMLAPRSKEGLPRKPESVIPTSPNEPTPPAFTTDGMLVGGSAALDNAVRWVTRRAEFYAQVVKEHRTDKRTVDEINGVLGVCDMLVTQISLMREARPGEARRYDRALSAVEDATARLTDTRSKARTDLFWEQ